MREEIIGTIPQGDGDKVLEVALMHDDAGQTEVELRYLVWGKGLGWYRQQTLILDGTTASNLLCRLSSVRHRLRPKADRRPEKNILPFPRRRLQRATAEPKAPLSGRERVEAHSAGGQG
jgi:hypothetical protein